MKLGQSSLMGIRQKATRKAFNLDSKQLTSKSSMLMTGMPVVRCTPGQRGHKMAYREKWAPEAIAPSPSAQRIIIRLKAYP